MRPTPKLWRRLGDVYGSLAGWGGRREAGASGKAFGGREGLGHRFAAAWVGAWVRACEGGVRRRVVVSCVRRETIRGSCADWSGRFSDLILSIAVEATGERAPPTKDASHCLCVAAGCSVSG